MPSYHYPRASGDRRIFRDDFLNLGMTIGGGGSPVGAALISRGLSGGQVIYYGPAHSVRYAGAVSIASNVVVSASGANQALWSIGTAASRRMEVGIDATGRPYAWGTAQVLLGTAVSDGHHDLGFSIGSDGSVWCVVDGELWGSGTVTFGSTFDRMLVGGSCLGTLPWAGEVKDLHIYRGQMDEAQMAHAMGASVGFQPESLLVGRDGLYLNTGLPNAVVNDGQPNVLNPGFELGAVSWVLGGAAPTFTVVSPGYGGINAGRITRGTSNAYLSQPALTNGCRYIVGGWGRTDAIAIPAAYTGGNLAWIGLASANWQAILGEQTAAATSLQLYLLNGTNGVSTCDFDDIYAINLSAKQLTCQGNRGHFLQATAASMGWGSDPRAPTSKPVNGRKVVYFDGVADRYTSSAVAADYTWLSNGSPAMWSVFAQPTSLAANSAGWSCFDGGAGSRGAFLRFETTGAIRFAVGYGGGYALDVTSAAGVVVAGQKHVVSGGYAGSGNYVVRLNGVAVISAPVVGASLLAPTGSLSLATLSSAAAINPYTGIIGDILAVNDYDVVNWLKLERAFANKFGVALP